MCWHIHVYVGFSILSYFNFLYSINQRPKCDLSFFLNYFAVAEVLTHLNHPSVWYCVGTDNYLPQPSAKVEFTLVSMLLVEFGFQLNTLLVRKFKFKQRGWSLGKNGQATKVRKCICLLSLIGVSLSFSSLNAKKCPSCGFTNVRLW